MGIELGEGHEHRRLQSLLPGDRFLDSYEIRFQSAFTVQLFYNYSNVATDTFTISPAAQENVTTATIQWAFQPSNPKAESIQIAISENLPKNATYSISVPGPSIYGVTLIIGTHEGTMRLPVTQRGSM